MLTKKICIHKKGVIGGYPPNSERLKLNEFDNNVGLEFSVVVVVVVVVVDECSVLRDIERLVVYIRINVIRGN